MTKTGTINANNLMAVAISSGITDPENENRGQVFILHFLDYTNERK